MATAQWKEQNQDKVKAYRREWYKKNATHAKQKVMDRKKELQLWFKEFKLTLKCSRCPEDYYACLDFHHIDPSTKECNLAHVIEKGWSRERIIKEVDKCVILCANCHRKEHTLNRGVVLTG